MSSLDNVPSKILQLIAFFSFVSSPVGPPPVLPFLLISRTIYNALNLKACPWLYAQVYIHKFDLGSFQRMRTSWLTDKCLAAELVRRFHVLRRISLRQLSEAHDLWTLYLMVLESDGLNEAYLARAGVAPYLFEFIRSRFREEYQNRGWPVMNEINALALWLAYLTASADTIMNESPTSRYEMLELLRPFTIGIARDSSVGMSDSHMFLRGDTSFDITADPLPGQGPSKVIYYSRKLDMLCPNVSSASILLYYLFKEASSKFEVPPRVPLTRSIANATQRPGPTAEDCFKMSHYRTPTVADQQQLFFSSIDMAGTYTSRSMMHNDDFPRAVLCSPAGAFLTGHAYAPGILSGLWEGYYLVSPPPLPDIRSPPRKPSDVPDFVSRFPMQCRLQEHFSSYPDGALPDSLSSEKWASSASNVTVTEETFEGSAQPSQRALTTSSTSTSNQDSEVAVIIGETQSDHELAFGAFKYTGKIRFRDGLIQLKRESKTAREWDGAWIFEGFLHSRRVLVGRWHSAHTSINDSFVEGVFCMSKRIE